MLSLLSTNLEGYPMFGRRKVAMIVAEFFGAATLTMTVLAVSKSNLGFALFVAAAVGFAMYMLVQTLGSVSGAHANPAVTLGLWTIRKISTTQAVVYVAIQLLGAFVAGRLFVYLINQPLENIAGKSFDWRVMSAEILGAFIFTFGIAAAVYQKYEGTRLAATIGGSLFLGIVLASVASNGFVNPAVALGAQSASRAYIFGPLVGGVLGMNVYAAFFGPTEGKTRVKAVAATKTKKKK